MLTVAYPGRDGTHAETACARLFPFAGTTIALPTFSAVAEAVAEGAIDFGVLPIETSLAGPVSETHDLLYRAGLSIADETILRIRHCLVGIDVVPLREIEIVRSHAAALDGCRKLLSAMPWATPVAAASTADAAASVAERGDRAEVAIASERAAAKLGLRVLRADVGDHPEAYTRFVTVATATRLDRMGEEWRTAFSFVTDHGPGALTRALRPFERAGINLCQLVSRPIREEPWNYRFDAVLSGHPRDPIVQGALREAGGLTSELLVFGSYPTEQPGVSRPLDEPGARLPATNGRGNGKAQSAIPPARVRMPR